jgi:type I restriction enzyme S subunit
MDAFAGAVGVSDSDGKGSPVYSVCEALSNANAGYYAYIIREMARSQWILALATGIRERSTDFRYGDFACQSVPVPPLCEQTAIVRYLDHADRKVRHVIRARQQLIKLLTEQKQSIIQRAVTRGLNPSVHFKPSAVDWLSGIPEPWQELPLKRLASIDNSGCYGDEPEKGCCVLPVATTAQIDADGHFAVDKMPLRSFSAGDATRYGCTPGDILVVKSSGSVVNVISGKAGIVNSEAPHFVFSNFLMRVVPKISTVDPQFLFLVLNSPLTHERVKRMVAGTTYPNLRVGEYISSLLPVPSLAEQKEIVVVLEEATANLDKAINAACREIDLLREYRTRLIADVVTGKLDVRDVPVLDDETDVPPEELENIDDVEATDESDDAAEGNSESSAEESA